MTSQEELDKEKRLISTEIAEGFGLPVTKGVVIANENNSFRIEFGDDVLVMVEYRPFIPRDDIDSFVQAIASFPEIFAQFGIDMADADSDFNKLLLTLKIIVALFASRAGADSADINIATSDGSKDEEILPF
jgi:hypothetical protein